MFFLVKAALPAPERGGDDRQHDVGDGLQGEPDAARLFVTKGAIVAFTRSLSKSLVEQGIRVNAVAPGPIWTPLIPSTFPPEKVETFGSDVPMKRPGQPAEVAPCFVFLASDDSSYIAGQVLHPNGGERRQRLSRGGRVIPGFSVLRRPPLPNPLPRGERESEFPLSPRGRGLGRGGDRRGSDPRSILGRPSGRLTGGLGPLHWTNRGWGRAAPGPPRPIGNPALDPGESPR